eukprot:10358543-Lingulodinium_polyedra.AAC.1
MTPHSMASTSTSREEPHGMVTSQWASSGARATSTRLVSRRRRQRAWTQSAVARSWPACRGKAP